MKGFTLIELMIVVAIIAIIAAIAIPNMLSTRQSAWQTAAAGFCRTAATTAETYRIKAGDYPINDTADDSGALVVGQMFDLTVGPPACSILTPSAARTYSWNYVYVDRNHWNMTGISTETACKSFYIDESGVLRVGTTNTNATSASLPYGG
jgi:prepilin-type N-terminal cleavage/methylation domain-containing protein